MPEIQQVNPFLVGQFNNTQGGQIPSVTATEQHAIDDWVPPSVLNKVPKRPKNIPNGTIGEVFGLGEPRQISQTESDKFFQHHRHLIPVYPFRFSSPKTLIGIEVEVENVMQIDAHIPIMLWTIKEDGSLRNYGKEFVTPGVIPVSLSEGALNLLFNGLNKDIEFSNRTSIHIHQDVRQLRLDQMVAFVLTYAAVENLLFKFVGNNRRNNIFCVPITEAGLLENLGNDPKRFISSINSSWSKYTALNLLPIPQQGSVEFRQLPGTNDVVKILRWIEMLTCFKTFVYKYDYHHIVNTIIELNSNSRYHQFVEMVFGDMAAYLDMSNLMTDMERPVYVVQNCSASNQFHQKVIQTKNKESVLFKKWNKWMEKLSTEQIKALTFLNDYYGMGDLESLFRDMVSRPDNYRRSWANNIDKVNIILGISDKQITVKMKSKQESLPF